MKMKTKKHHRRHITGSAGTNPSSDSDQEQLVKSPRQPRSSQRLKDQKSSSKSTSKESLVDSAYEADEDSNSSPTPQLTPDPYEIEMIEDLRASDCRSQNKKRAGGQNKNKTGQKSKTKKTGGGNKNVPTSTPVLMHETRKQVLESPEERSLVISPEITPILPVKSQEPTPSPQSDESFITPQVRRSTRKRANPFSGDLKDISSSLSYASQGDSGIVVSPPSKKHQSNCGVSRPTSTPTDPPSRFSKQKRQVVTKSKKEQSLKTTPIIFGEQFLNKKNLISDLSSRENSLKTEKSLKSEDDHCFGFDSLGSPIFSPSPKSRPEKRSAKKSRRSPKSHYRSPGEQSDTSRSSPSKGRELFPMETQENTGTKPSAHLSLFSDDVFSDDPESMELNRSSTQTYKASRMKKTERKPCLTSKSSNKFDAWVSHFNTNMEDIERFDLIIE